MSDDLERASPRLGRAHLNDEIVEPLFRGEYLIIDGVPDDARFKRMFRDVRSASYAFIFESEEFEPVGEADEIPRIDITVSPGKAESEVSLEEWKRLAMANMERLPDHLFRHWLEKELKNVGDSDG